MSQDSIASSRLARSAAIASAGAKVGLNYLKHYGRRALTRETAASSEEKLHAENAADVYRTFSELKGGPLKVAQMLSIDQNLLPRAYTQHFAQAQYSAPPLSYPLVVRTFRKEFGREPLELFDTFGREAVAGASIGQVHRASRGGREFAVKVQYPGVADSLRNDLRLVKPIALRMLGLRERDVAGYFAEVEERLLEETNYTLELERSQQLSTACRGVENVSFPEYHPELCRPRILTMDWIDGEPLDRFADGSAGQEERDRLGQALWDFYDFQVHRLHLFHADPHPGNFLVRDGRLWVLDFGCTKALPEDVYRRQFRLLDPAVADDPARLEAALIDLHLLLPDDPPESRAELLRVCGESIALLARPFRTERFDFGQEGFLAAIFALGEANHRNEQLRRMRGARGTPDSVYVNRAYFGLYSLLSRLRARVRVQLPEWLRSAA
ncbi:MAG: AarF/ABC1/UbiB kinase family protein [Verrucomicrobia bacterium]|nr:AarF/ABC1/UbiB kinase family protein [Verrucomicrobiota bacterium]